MFSREIVTMLPSIVWRFYQIPQPLIEGKIAGIEKV